jgi:hypothetical protein
MKVDYEFLMQKGAEFSPCRNYRYVLWRVWDLDLPRAMCIGLNPSTANAESDDPTIRNLVRILRNNGYGSLYMTNLFPLVSPHPEDLRKCPDPVKDNDHWLIKMRQHCHGTIFCWGNFPMAEYRAKKVIPMFGQPMCFGRNANGSPKHPLYLKGDTKLQLFNL